MAEEVLSITGLKKTYQTGDIRVPVIKDLDLSVKEGEIICLFGRSGSGKTTLLNLIGALDTPDDGKIVIAGKNIAEISTSALAGFRRKHIGFVFQYFNLVPYLTALENVMLPMKYEGIPRKERIHRAEEMLSGLGLKERMHFTMASLSGGQIQRVAFARAAVMQPTLVLADEPTGQLDNKTAQELASIIVTMNRENKRTFILATHDPVLSSVAHRVFLVEDGSLGVKHD